MNRRQFVRQACCAAVGSTGILSTLGQLRVIGAVAADGLDRNRAAALADQLNLVLCANQMTAATRTRIVDTLTALPASSTDLERVQIAVQFTVISPSGAAQR